MVPLIQTSGVQLLDAWRAAGPADTIVCGVVALHGQSEGNLEKVRLGRIAEVVSVESSLDPTVAFALVPDVPAALDVPNVDGVMVFGTTATKVARTCVDVRLVSIRDLRTAGELNPQNVRQLLTLAKKLGSVVFEGTTVADGLDRVLDRWRRHWCGRRRDRDRYLAARRPPRRHRRRNPRSSPKRS